ncbi:MAG: hypothetical protein GC160_18175 [Acidobacteria bacterium]|nr:hypothetical protein [Acidobacteriota bacterium]
MHSASTLQPTPTFSVYPRCSEPVNRRRYAGPVESESGFEVLDHVADTGFRCWGPTYEQCLLAAGRAFLALAVETESVAARDERLYEIEGEDPAERLVDWLNDLLFTIDANLFAPREVVAVDERAPGRWVARVVGEGPRDPARHPWKLIIKGATYHELDVSERNGRWEAQVILDV